MNKLKAIELEDSDFAVESNGTASDDLLTSIFRSAVTAEVVLYRGALVKNRGGEATLTLAGARAIARALRNQQTIKAGKESGE